MYVCINFHLNWLCNFFERKTVAARRNTSIERHYQDLKGLHNYAAPEVVDDYETIELQETQYENVAGIFPINSIYASIPDARD